MEPNVWRPDGAPQPQAASSPRSRDTSRSTTTLVFTATHGKQLRITISVPGMPNANHPVRITLTAVGVDSHRMALIAGHMSVAATLTRYIPLASELVAADRAAFTQCPCPRSVHRRALERLHTALRGRDFPR